MLKCVEDYFMSEDNAVLMWPSKILLSTVTNRPTESGTESFCTVTQSIFHQSSSHLLIYASESAGD